jgi:hypothetical protein
MAGRDVAAASAAFTANGGTDGSITMASTTAFRKNAKCWLTSSGQPSLKVIITEVTDATHLKVRSIPDQLTLMTAAQIGSAPGGSGGPVATVRHLGDFAPKYGTTDISAYTLAQTAKIDQESQFIYDEPR